MEGERFRLRARIMNLAGILSPEPHIPAITPHRLLLRDGVAIAALKAGEGTIFEAAPREGLDAIERALRVGTMPESPRSYYA